MTCKANTGCIRSLPVIKRGEDSTWLEKKIEVLSRHCLLAILTLINVCALIFTEGS